MHTPFRLHEGAQLLVQLGRLGGVRGGLHLVPLAAATQTNSAQAQGSCLGQPCCGILVVRYWCVGRTHLSVSSVCSAAVPWACMARTESSVPAASVRSVSRSYAAGTASASVSANPYMTHRASAQHPSQWVRVSRALSPSAASRIPSCVRACSVIFSSTSSLLAVISASSPATISLCRTA
jgi:hypothetical protein